MPSSADDPFHLQRFVDAQAGDHVQALAELRAGRKRGHWIWYVLPQLRGLGQSSLSQHYGIGSLAEARAYLAHALLGPRLRACVAALVALPGHDAVAVLGDIDAMKLHSCLTLFAVADAAGAIGVHAAPPVFALALQKYFGGQPDPASLALMARP